MIQDVAVVGAGPYGLSIAAYLRRYGISHRIFGPPMDTWLSHMPKGMMLKSDGFASDLYDPDGKQTLKQFCAERNIPYADKGLPIPVETFTAYGLDFQKKMVPDLENKIVSDIRSSENVFGLHLSSGEECLARRIVLAVGVTHFEHVPKSLAHLPKSLLTHSFRHCEVRGFKGQRVAVVGGGASALDLAGLLHQAEVDVQLITRRTELKFHNKPTGQRRPFWQRLRHPDSGLGPGLRSRFFSDAPWAFHNLPEALRLAAVRRTLGPSGGYSIREMVIGKVPLLLGYGIVRAMVEGDSVRLQLQDGRGSTKEIQVEHVIAATGYRVDLERLGFLSTELRSGILTAGGAPILSSDFQCSVRGIYFVGLSAANSFGPVMRFAFGARFAANRLSRALATSVARTPSVSTVTQFVASTKSQ